MDAAADVIDRIATRAWPRSWLESYQRCAQLCIEHSGAASLILNEAKQEVRRLRSTRLRRSSIAFGRLGGRIRAGDVGAESAAVAHLNELD